MGRVKITSLVFASVLVASTCAAVAAEPTVCSIVAHSDSFDHQKVDLRGLAADVRETTSKRGNDYTTFSLVDPSGCGAIKVFVWGHPQVTTGGRICVTGEYEREHHEGKYTFRDEVQANNASACSN